MLRFAVSELGQAALPAVDLDDDPLVIGSGPEARIRISGLAAQAAHVRIAGQRWTALAAVRVDGRALSAAETGEIAAGTTFELDRYRVHVSPSPPGAIAATPQRTESLARELVRSLLGAGSAPAFEVERGPTTGAKRMLAPPESTLVIGRGDEASWVILDPDLSRAHVEVHRGWDGVTIRDLASKNGTRVDGVVADGAVALHHGVLVELGNVALRFRDPAEHHLRAEAPRAAPPAAAVTRALPSVWPFVIAAMIAGLAVVGLIWVLAT